MNHILILSRSEKGTPKSNGRYNSGRLLLTLSKSSTILTESKPEVQKILICSKSIEGTAESSGATRFSNTSVKSSKSLWQMHETGNCCKQTWEIKSDISKYWATCVLQFFVNQAVTSQNLKLTLKFLIKPFRYMTKKSRQKLKYPENKKSFWGEIKSIFHHF